MGFKSHSRKLRVLKKMKRYEKRVNKNKSRNKITYKWDLNI